MPVSQARQIARERELDLVEVAPNADPAVCRLLDYGRFRYDQAKKEHESRKHQKTILVKELRFRPKIDDHDIDFKMRQAQKMLADGDKIKLTVRFRGREMAHPEQGRMVLDRVVSKLEGHGVVEQATVFEGRNMSLVMAPARGKKAKKESGEGGAQV